MLWPYIAGKRAHAVVTSIGLAALPWAGRYAAIAACKLEDSCGTCKPWASHKSVSSTPVPPELLMMATRGPRKTPWQSKAAATSNSVSPSSTNIAPAWRKRARVIAKSCASAAVWLLAARCPAWLRPVLRITTGLCGVTARRACTSAAPSETDSRTSASTRVAGSAPKKRTASTSFTSALLPADSTLEKPIAPSCERENAAIA